jgi:hypothetical protein
MIKQLHFLPWSNYFTERIVNKIITYNKEAHFIVWKPEKNIERTHSIFTFQEMLSFVTKNCNKETTFITHSLVLPVAILLGMTKWKNNPSSWITWGAEYNSILNITKTNRNAKVLTKLMSISLKHKFSSYIRIKAIKNINRVFSTPGEIDLLKALLNLQCECIPHHSYFELNEISKIPLSEKEDYLLIGNSNDPSNLHCQAIEWVYQLNYKGNILIPLPEASVDYIKNVIDNLIGFKNTSLIFTKTINAVKFEQMISKCKFAIMYHDRQQAMLTIYILLWQGVKVFLKEVNPLVKLLKGWGIHFSVIENMSDKNVWQELNEKEINYNRERILSVLSSEIISSQYQKYLS